MGWTAPDFVCQPDNGSGSDSADSGSFMDQSISLLQQDGSEELLHATCLLIPLSDLMVDVHYSEITTTINCAKRQVEFLVDGKVVKTLNVKVRNLQSGRNV